jgi:hypothetical protein
MLPAMLAVLHLVIFCSMAQVTELVKACRHYMLITLGSSKPAWAWVVFTIAHQLNMEDLSAAAAVRLTSAALVSKSWVTKASIAVKALESNPRLQLQVLSAGISKATYGAMVISQALLVVLLMRLNQLGPAGGSTGGSSSSSSNNTAGKLTELLPFLHDECILSLLKLVKWDTMHYTELTALSSQSRSYRPTAAAAYVKDQLLQQLMVMMMQGPGVSLTMDGLPPGQPNVQYLTGWVKSCDMKGPAVVNSIQSSSLSSSYFWTVPPGGLGWMRHVSGQSDRGLHRYAPTSSSMQEFKCQNEIVMTMASSQAFHRQSGHNCFDLS